MYSIVKNEIIINYKSDIKYINKKLNERFLSLYKTSIGTTIRRKQLFSKKL